jgi:hypothetical protein
VATDGTFSFRVFRSQTTDRTTSEDGTSLAGSKAVKVWLAVTNRASEP